MRIHGPLFAAALTVLAGSALTGSPFTPTARAGDVFPTWQFPQDGLWNNALFWSPAIVPLPSQSAILPHADAYTVTMDFGTQNTLSGLTISNPLARLDISPLSGLTMQGPIVNDGTITINPTNTAFNSGILYTLQAGIGGSGRINLAGDFLRSQINTAPGAFIIHEPPHVIEGTGVIPAAMINNSTIRATNTAHPLTLNTEPKTNNNLLQAQNGATLNIRTVINQSGTGLIRATGPGSVVGLQAAVINNGRITATGPGSVVGLESAVINNAEINGTGGGVIATTSFAGTLNSTLNNVTNLGNFEVRAFYSIIASNTLDNLGTITVNPTNAPDVARVRFTDNAILQGPGRVILTGWGGRAEISTSPGETFTHQSPHTIEGSGVISAAMTNNSPILANNPAHPLTLNAQPKTNNNLIQAQNGATLNITSVINQSSSGLIRATGPGSVVGLQSAVINNGIINGTDGGVITTTSPTSTLTSTLNNVTNLGDFEVRDFYSIIASNTLDNLGTITVNPSNVANATTIRFTDNAILQGPGRVILTGWGLRAEISTTPGETFTHQSPHTIEGSGRISAAMINNSPILANNPAHHLTLSAETKTNNSLMQAQNGSSLHLDTVTINQGPDGLIRAQGPGAVVELQTATINNGEINGEGGGIIITSAGSSTNSLTSTLNNVTNRGNLEVRAARPLQIAGSVRNDGRMTINPTNSGAATSLIWTDDSALTGNGTVTLAGLTSRANIAIAAPATVATFGPDQRLEGIGRIAAPLTMHGTLAPGLSVGTMEAIQPVTMTPTGVFEAEIAAPTTADRLASTSTFHADGTLRVHLIDGYNPAAYWTASIVTATQGVTGRFAQILAPAPADPRLDVRARYLPTEIRVGAFCKGDFNADAQLNFFDVSDFLALYNLQDPSTDLAPPFGVINFFDLSAYLTRYNQGCP